MSAQFLADWQAWHDRRERALAAPYGWLSLIALEWLGGVSAGPLVLEHFPGSWHLDGPAVVYEPDPAFPVSSTPSPVASDGTPDTAVSSLITTPVNVLPDTDAQPTLLFAGKTRAEVIARDGRFAIRLRDPRAPTRTAFTHVPVFPVDAQWRFPARFIPSRAHDTIEVASAVPGISHHDDIAGVLHFEAEGQALSLQVLGSHGGPFSTMFTDATSGTQTYGAGRFLNLPAGPSGRPEMIDFTRSYNPPCVFTHFCTCPVPPPSNRLPIAVTAGERL